MSQPDLGELLAKAQQAQAKLASLQQELARRSVEGSAGAGMVVAKATGDLRIVEIRIEPSLVESGDREMIQDLVAAAVNAALAAAQRMAQQEFQRASIGFPLPGAPGGTPESGR